MPTKTKRGLSAVAATAVGATMLVAAPAAQAAPPYNNERAAQVTLNVPRPALGRSNSATVQLTSDAGRPNGLVIVRVRRQNGKIIAKRTCRTRGNSSCTVRFKAPRRGKAGFVVARYVGNSKFENDIATLRFRYRGR